MAHVVEVRVLETSTSTTPGGVGTLTLAGAISGFRTFGAVMANGDTCEYYAEAVDSNGVPTGDWEEGIGTWGTGGILTRTYVKRSSNANAPVAFIAGTKRVAMIQAVSGIIADAPSADQNDYIPSGWATAQEVWLTPTTSIIITGLSASGVSHGTQKILRNRSTNKLIVLCDEAVTTSSAANRVKMGLGVANGHQLLIPGDAVAVSYDATISRWVLVGAPRAGTLKRWIEREVYGIGSSGLMSASYTVGNTGAVSAGDIYAAGSDYSTKRQCIGIKSSTSANATAVHSVNENVTTQVVPYAYRVRWGMGYRFQTAPGLGATMFVGMVPDSVGASMPITQPSTFLHSAGFTIEGTSANMRMTYSNGSVSNFVDLGTSYQWNNAWAMDGTIFNAGDGTLAMAIWRMDDLSVMPKVLFASTNTPAYTAGGLRTMCGVCNQSLGVTAQIAFFHSILLVDG